MSVWKITHKHCDCMGLCNHVGGCVSSLGAGSTHSNCDIIIPTTTNSQGREKWCRWISPLPFYIYWDFGTIISHGVSRTRMLNLFFRYSSGKFFFFFLVHLILFTWSRKTENFTSSPFLPSLSMTQVSLCDQRRGAILLLLVAYYTTSLLPIPSFYVDCLNQYSISPIIC